MIRAALRATVQPFQAIIGQVALVLVAVVIFTLARDRRAVMRERARRESQDRDHADELRDRGRAARLRELRPGDILYRD